MALTSIIIFVCLSFDLCLGVVANDLPEKQGFLPKPKARVTIKMTDGLTVNGKFVATADGLIVIEEEVRRKKRIKELHVASIDFITVERGTLVRTESNFLFPFRLIPGHAIEIKLVDGGTAKGSVVSLDKEFLHIRSKESIEVFKVSQIASLSTDQKFQAKTFLIGLPVGIGLVLSVWFSIPRD